LLPKTSEYLIFFTIPLLPIEYTVAHIATSIFDNLLNKIYTMFKFTFGKLTIQLLPPKITWKL